MFATLDKNTEATIKLQNKRKLNELDYEYEKQKRLFNSLDRDNDKSVTLGKIIRLEIEIMELKRA